MPRVFKHICSAYNCNVVAKYKREIDGHMFKFCEAHKYCLNHSRAENIINMIKGSSLKREDLPSRFNEAVCGYSYSVVNETVTILIKEKHLSIVDGCLTLYKSPDTCMFPGCMFKKDKGSYCSSHKSLPNYKVISSLMKLIHVIPKTAAEISEESSLSVQTTVSILKKLIRTGYVSVERTGIANYYSAQ